jgi:hypothetical protein
MRASPQDTFPQGSETIDERLGSVDAQQRVGEGIFYGSFTPWATVSSESIASPMSTFTSASIASHLVIAAAPVSAPPGGTLARGPVSILKGRRERQPSLRAPLG